MPPYIPEQTAYAFFGIAPTASPFEIQDAYRRLARKFPADRVWDTPMASAAKTGLQEVERWHAMIGSPEARAAYDAMLAAKRRAVTAEFHAGVDGVDSTGPYHRLGLPEDETLNMTALRSAYHKAIRQHHPDKQSSQDRSSAALIAIAEAYTTLADPFRRCVYHRRRQVALDPACIVSLRLCGHLLPNDDDVGDDVGDDDTAEELVQDAPSDAPATSHPAQMTTFQAWHSLMQVWWNVALDAAGRLLAWLKRK
ncbi:DnaJ-like protein xdj1 [Sporothrix curviconia]|uniref:DnaJ-like protein xdj1 n=1 Tax=Sporothrix curviconia TaxID=1260050 RepID=A0ABP0AY74_9PEZI